MCKKRANQYHFGVHPCLGKSMFAQQARGRMRQTLLGSFHWTCMFVYECACVCVCVRIIICCIVHWQANIDARQTF